MDDEQGPWWTRPPEPGPRVRLRDSGTSLDDSADPESSEDPYDTEIYRPGAAQQDTRAYPPAAPQSPNSPTPDPWSDPYAGPTTGRHSVAPAPEQPEGPSPYAPDSGVPTQGGWPDATPVPQPPAPYQPINNASTMPLPVIEDPAAGESTQPSPVAPAPAPKKAKPVIRRVAAPPPPPPAPPAPPAAPQASRQTKPKPAVPADRNAYAPPQNGDIWATFSGPIPLPDEVLAQRGQAPQKAAAPPPPPVRPTPQPDGDDEPQSPLKHFLTVQLPEARFVLIAIAGGLVVLLIVLVALLSGGGGRDGDGDEVTPAASPSGLSGMPASNLTEVKKVPASKMLQRAGASAGGKIVEAYEWDDKNGKNLVAAVEVAAAKKKTTLKVVHVVGLDGGDPEVKRSMIDPDLPQCASGRAGGQAAFAKDGMQIQDLDSNGYAEVIVGWSSRCGKPNSESQAKLALLSNGDKYIVRGSGVLGSKSGSADPDPSADDWPNGFYDTVMKRYQELFFTVSK